MTDLSWWQEVTATAVAVLAILAVLRIVLQPWIDRGVIKSITRESSLWKEEAKKHFSELFTPIAIAENTSRALKDQADEMAELRKFVHDVVKPLVELPKEIATLSNEVRHLSSAVDKLQGLSEAVAILKDRVGVRSTDLPARKSNVD